MAHNKIKSLSLIACLLVLLVFVLYFEQLHLDTYVVLRWTIYEVQKIYYITPSWHISVMSIILLDDRIVHVS